MSSNNSIKWRIIHIIKHNMFIREDNRLYYHLNVQSKIFEISGWIIKQEFVSLL